MIACPVARCSAFPLHLHFPLRRKRANVRRMSKCPFVYHDAAPVVTDEPGGDITQCCVYLQACEGNNGRKVLHPGKGCDPTRMTLSGCDQPGVPRNCNLQMY